MCGIFGFVSPRPTKVDWERLQELAQLNQLRGSRSSGYLAVSGSSQIIRRFPTSSIVDALRQHEGPAWGTPFSAILCHSKAPTIGESSLETTQPVEDKSSSMILGHNGSILNWRSIDMTVPFDTPSILTAIRLPEEKYILEGLPRLDGQHACWLFTKSTRQIYLWRVMSPLYIAHFAQTTWFSSVIPTSEVESWSSLDEGVLYLVESGVESRGSFAYQSIY